jgi:hypothetical protein
MPVVILGWEMAPSGQGDDLPAAHAAVEPGIGCGLVRSVDGVKGRAATVVQVLTAILIVTLRMTAGTFRLFIRVMDSNSLAMVQLARDDIPAILRVVAGAFLQLRI